MENVTSTISDLAIATPGAIPVLERLGIDYCCNGRQPIADACRRAGVTPEELLAMIGTPSTTVERKWESEALATLLRFIVDTHHVYTRQALTMLPTLAIKVRDHHGPRYAELATVETLTRQLSADLMPHMMKEENVLFPYVAAMEEATLRGEEAPIPFFATIKNPIRMMMLEHEAAGEIVAELRGITANYALPDDACTSFRALYAGLQELETDLHRHIHLDNNILFPRSIEVENHSRMLVTTR
jgi:regulator of cell morphogenesis and NO signaling